MSKKPKKTPAGRKGWVKAIRMTVKWTWIPITCVAALFVGLSVGYVYIGKQSMDEVFELATWRHLFDLVFANT
ncbi:DNA-directed RNA polymerase subunit beta [Paenibacillus allorhizosphaerae]|uniref:DNA-directed RNA polymerase subunit beta n=1 Tax=Paenibacillus allorhizosphaerae TaxID=2849866 RepID=A0ABM8VRN1_9BACL|nr:DNA-directed RNA polymerase subunit beta [Paenibacillus allorhizosphaerae]CAG7655530.1 hypothetical protein PAECIP111802_06134 [Paenibacillus allorhizosphaerae]